jgi:hypothetical protein
MNAAFKDLNLTTLDNEYQIAELDDLDALDTSMIVFVVIGTFSFSGEQPALTQLYQISFLLVRAPPCPLSN